MHTKPICCITSLHNCSLGAKLYTDTIYNKHDFIYSIVSKDFCKINANEKIIELQSQNGFYFIPFNATKFVVCKNSLNFALQKQKFVFKFIYSIDAPIYNSTFCYIFLRKIGIMLQN